MENPLRLLTNNGHATAALRNLLNFFNIKADTKEDIVKSIQCAWLRQAGKERWEVEDRLAHTRDVLMPLLVQAHAVNAREPQRKEYDYLLVLGTLQHETQNRLDHAVLLWNKGIYFKEIVFLGSERPLIAQQEPACTIEQCPTPKTEYDMMRWIYERTNVPDAMRALKTTFINTSNTLDSNGQIKRATTADTIHAWLQINPKPGSVLVISNQPYIGYQSAVVETILPSSFPFETVGQELATDTSMSEILDTLARWVYQENKLLDANLHT